jgi:NAD(P)-dependent dehydrogenase (short-subunit alcohol dehydrogenase family)
MSEKLQFRRPVLLPYLQRFLAHLLWNLKSLFMPARALRQRVEGRVVLITGASSGIGELAARRLAAAGATVLMTARSEDKLQALANELRAAGGKAQVYAGNLAVMEDCDRVCAEVLRDHGRVDILVNNAGRSIRRSVKFSFDRFHDYERTMQLNFFGSLRMAMNLLPGMLARNEGHIINITTLGISTFPARFSAYLSSKCALEAWSWVLANEIAHTNVRVSTVNYPLVSTPMIAPSLVYRYMPWKLSPETACRWLMDMVITQNKRKTSVAAYLGVFVYWVLPKTTESLINLLYQGIHEPPPDSYAQIMRNNSPEALEQARRDAAAARTAAAGTSAPDQTGAHP